MNAFDYTVTTDKTFDEAVASLEAKTGEKGFRVLHVHDIAATLTDKGFPRDPLKILEVCNAKIASEVLARDIKLSLMLPCPISVYVEGGKTHISTMLPTVLSRFFPDAGIEPQAAEVERILLQIIEEVR